MFQFLIGRLKTYSGQFSRMAGALFQFLIGRLKTIVDNVYNFYPIQFQFLIGRLKTNYFGLQSIPTEAMFQFLIGRLKTHHACNSKRFDRLVSIPYRQAKNFFFCICYFFFYCLFQFLIGRLKTCSVHFRPFMPNWFQFLIGRLKTSMKYSLLNALLCFNSLQVG